MLPRPKRQSNQTTSATGRKRRIDASLVNARICEAAGRGNVACLQAGAGDRSPLDRHIATKSDLTLLITADAISQQNRERRACEREGLWSF